jgi:hypothetical protein
MRDTASCQAKAPQTDKLDSHVAYPSLPAIVPTLSGMLRAEDIAHEARDRLQGHGSKTLASCCLGRRGICSTFDSALSARP